MLKHNKRRPWLFLYVFTVMVLAGCSDTSTLGDRLFGHQAPSPTDVEPLEARRFPAGQQAQPAPGTPPKAEDLGMKHNLPPAPEAKTQRTLKVGLLLPLSGENAKLGQSMQDAAFLALNDKFNSIPAEMREETRVILIPKDTKGNGTDAFAAARQAVSEGAQVFLGPVFAKELESIAPFARSNNINIVSFSSNRALAGNGVFLMSFLPEQQIERIVNHAADKGVTRIAALLPNDPYGQTVRDALNRAAAARNMNVAAVAFYPRGANNVRGELSKLFAKTGETAAAPDGGHGFEALLIPEGGDRINGIMEDIKALGIDTSRLMLLGSGQWDDDSFTLSPLLSGAVYAGTDPDRRRTFERHFKNTYGYQPERLATLAYDGMALITTLAYNQPSRTPARALFTASQLTHPAGFNGPVDGIFRFLQGGLSERGLAIVEITAGGPKVRERAPTMFR